MAEKAETARFLSSSPTLFLLLLFGGDFFQRKEVFSRERGLECINERTDVRGLERSCLCVYKNRKKRGGEGGGESVGVRVYYYRWL